MINQDQIKEISTNQEIDEFSILREYIQVLFLSILYNQKESQEIYFKGGTAIKLLFFPARFSEDLDFTTTLSVEKIKKILFKIEKNLKEIVPEIYIKDILISDLYLQGILTFKKQEDKFNLNVHLDFSLREKPAQITTTLLETKYPINSLPMVIHLSWEEVLSEKIRALFSRTKGRDVFDIWLLLSKGVDLNIDLINKKLEIYKISVKFQDILNKIETFSEDILKQDLGQFLSRKNRPIVSQLKTMLIKTLKEWNSFSIKESLDLDYSKDCFSEIIKEINKQDDGIQVTLSNSTAFISSNNKKGDLKLDYIYQNKSQFKNKTYKELIDFQFKKY